MSQVRDEYRQEMANTWYSPIAEKGWPDLAGWVEDGTDRAACDTEER